MKSQRAWDILERAKVLGLERSIAGSVTVFRSPARMSLCESRFGIREMKLLMKPISSQLGAYTLISTTGVLKREPDTIMNRPWGSEIVFEGVNNIFLWINIATPRALVLNAEWKVCPTQFFRSLTWSAMVRWVSCKNATPTFNFFRWENIRALLIGPFKPLTFQLIHRVEDTLTSALLSFVSSDMCLEREEEEGVESTPHSRKAAVRQQLIQNNSHTKCTKIPFGSIKTCFNTEWTKSSCVNNQTHPNSKNNIKISNVCLQNIGRPLVPYWILNLPGMHRVLTKPLTCERALTF